MYRLPLIMLPAASLYRHNNPLRCFFAAVGSCHAVAWALTNGELYPAIKERYTNSSDSGENTCIGGNHDRLFEITPYCIILDCIVLKAVGLCVKRKWKKRWFGYLHRIVLNDMRIIFWGGIKSGYAMCERALYER